MHIINTTENSSQGDVAQILVLVYEKPDRDLIMRLLNRNGYICFTAADAKEAHEIIKNHYFQLILCDIKIPGDSVMHFIRYVSDEHPKTAVVIMSAIDEPDIVETALELGAYNYIYKPFAIEELLLSVENALGRGKVDAQGWLNLDNLDNFLFELTEGI